MIFNVSSGSFSINKAGITHLKMEALNLGFSDELSLLRNTIWEKRKQFVPRSFHKLTSKQKSLLESSPTYRSYLQLWNSAKNLETYWLIHPRSYEHAMEIQKKNERLIQRMERKKGNHLRYLLPEMFEEW